MKSIIKTLAIFTSFFFLVSCKKEGATYNIYVYTTRYDEVSTIFLNLNDQPKGEIPYFAQKQSFETLDSLKAKALVLHLNYGKYPITARDRFNNIKADGNLKFKRRNTDLTAIIGEMLIATKDKDIIIEINYK
ncbi:MAG: hypothetical protein HYX39_09245 [Bacteroidetes bacterium]|nr:hypothetical protein [Bacteroidota bacterium]